MVLQHVEHGGIVGGNAVDALGQQVRAQLVRNCLADQPERVPGQPAIRCLGLVEFQFFFQQVAQAIEQLALQSVLRGRHGTCWITAQGLGNRSTVGLNHQLAEDTGVPVLAGQDVQQCGPEWGIAAEPVENLVIEHLPIEQARCRAVQAVLAILPVAESIGAGQRAVPGVPDAAVGMFDV
ncbi:hypothetical protein FQZ97_1058000 [compost metagenome]